MCTYSLIIASMFTCPIYCWSWTMATLPYHTEKKNHIECAITLRPVDIVDMLCIDESCFNINLSLKLLNIFEKDTFLGSIASKCGKLWEKQKRVIVQFKYTCNNHRRLDIEIQFFTFVRFHRNRFYMFLNCIAYILH